MKRHTAASRLSAVTIAILLAGAAPVGAQKSDVVATVNGMNITEQDVKMAEADIGSELGQLDPMTKRRVLVEFLIENSLFAEAAETAKLASGPAYEQRLAYWRRRALRDIYFDTSVKGAVTDAEAKALYDKQIGGRPGEEEVKARHILVDTEQKAKDIHAKLGQGGNFDQLAKDNSKDPGSKDRGGDLGYFGRGQMVPQFEEVAFKLKKGETSVPVQSQFGWHIIKLDDRRARELPKFEDLKDRILTSLASRKSQEIALGLRNAAKIEFIDPELKKQAEDEAKAEPKKQ